jgi:hypothetical protein
MLLQFTANKPAAVSILMQEFPIPFQPPKGKNGFGKIISRKTIQ